MTPRNVPTQAESPALPAAVEPARGWPVPSIVAAEGDKAGERLFTYFTDTIRNKNTRSAYFRNACRLMAWCEGRGLTLKTIRSFHVSAYVEELGTTHEPPSVKQHLAAIRMLFDWLSVGQVVELNPAQAVRGPKHVVKKGKTPVLGEDEARALLKSIDGGDLVSLRDRALIAVCLYSFARIEAALGMDVEDYYPQGKRWWFRLREKGGKHHEMPAHHKAEEYVDAYITAAGLKDQRRHPLFRSALGKSQQL